MKKLFFVFIISLIILTPIKSYGARASIALGENSKASILIEANTNAVIFANNENKRMPIASMTKIMLLNLCFEAVDGNELSLDEEITVSKTASGMGGSQVFLEANCKYLAKDLIKSIIIASANDASVAMAERLFSSEADCVQAMNDKCREWGLNDTLFSNCTGLPKPTQYSSAYDVAIMLSKLIRHKQYFEYSSIWMDEISHGKDRVTGLTNTNKLVRFYEGCDGGKTGFTQESGFCLAATAKRGGLRLISVVINASDSKGRFADVSNMFDYGFENFTNKMVVDSSKPLDVTVKIEKSKKSSINVAPKENVFIFCERTNKDKITIDFEPYEIKAPISCGDVVGKLKVFKNSVEFKSVDVISLEDVLEKTYFDYIKDIGKSWL
ncbi:MAG: D-alanyl-D-alanine carboxypeptidase [Clostridia bacterium]|nr:D-alanyl-D-alanine carboxypeptidase [Clostridia bacterium]